jgi:hypothetical protein
MPCRPAPGPWDPRPLAPPPACRPVRFAVTPLAAVAALVMGAAAVPGAGPLSGQETALQADAELRTVPGGAVLGTLHAGTVVRVEEGRDGWSRVAVEGTVWIQSLQVRREGEFDLVVSAPEGETLRDTPQGRAAGHLLQGALLEERGRSPGWVRVRRSAWIPSEAVAASSDGAPSGAGAAGTQAVGASRPGLPPPTSTPPPTGAPPPTAAMPPSPDWIRVGSEGLAVLAAPAGDTVGRTGAGTELQVVDREGSWARVRLDGWVWLPDAAPPGEAGEDEAEEVLTGVSIRAMVAEPERFRGRRIELELEHLALERAEAIRTDFYEGEPFLLTRTREGERRFVYVAIPRDRLGEVEGLGPLEPLRVTGRVRTAAAAFTGNPVVDLIRLERPR